MAYAAPATLEDALALMREGAGPAIAGGTDLYPALGERPTPARLLDLTAIAALRGIAAGPEGWRIGALTTWAEIAAHPFPPAFDGLRAAARMVGSVQIQNAGTIGGNLCTASPAADGVPPLLTLDAEVEVAGAEGARYLPLSEFLTGPRRTALRPGELLVAVHIPPPPEAAAGAFVKLGARAHLVISIAMAAAVVAPGAGGRIGAARVAVGACSPVAARLSRLEAALAGVEPGALDDPALAAAHLGPLAPIDDVRADAGYRRAAAAEIARRALREAAAGAGLIP